MIKNQLATHGIMFYAHPDNNYIEIQGEKIEKLCQVIDKKPLDTSVFKRYLSNITGLKEDVDHSGLYILECSNEKARNDTMKALKKHYGIKISKTNQLMSGARIVISKQDLDIILAKEVDFVATEVGKGRGK